jgi:DNA repair protein RecO (recombination protein O)
MSRAFVLHTRPFRDRSVLCDWFSDAGRLVAIVSKTKKKSPQPFQPFWLEHQSARGDFSRIKRMEMQGPAFPLTGMALFCGLYVNELILLSCPINDPQEDLMTVYEATLKALAHDDQCAITLRRFELALIHHCGYALPFDTVDPDGYYRFDENQGLVVSDNQLDGAYKGAVLQAIGRGAWDDVALRSAKALLRSVIDVLVQPRVIKTRRMMQALAEHL